jgi:hypothetical protein
LVVMLSGVVPSGNGVEAIPPISRKLAGSGR